MTTRITILLDDDLAQKLRLLQAKKIKKSKKAVSFSRVLNEAVRKGI